MTTKPYGMICPITKACELLEPRWTIPILTELLAGSSRFNDLRRGIGSISPTLLSKRLREMEEAGLVERVADRASGSIDYICTQRAIDLEPALNALSVWAQKHIEAEIACDTNLSALMWKMRRYILPQELPNRRLVMQFRFSDDDVPHDTYWALIQPGAPVEICTAIPGFEIDLYIETSVKSLAAVLLARSTVAREVAADRLFLSGDALLARTMPRWLYTTRNVPEDGARSFCATAPEMAG